MDEKEKGKKNENKNTNDKTKDEDGKYAKLELITLVIEEYN